jgi:hypothetical protein
MANGWGPPKKLKDPTPIEKPALGHKRILLTGHAQQQMAIRGISVEDVLQTLRHPTKQDLPVQAGRPNRKRFRWNKTARVSIDVVHERIQGELYVITAIKVVRRLGRRKQ